MPGTKSYVYNLYVCCMCVYLYPDTIFLFKKSITYKAGFITLILQTEQMRYKDGNLDTVL